MPVAPSLATPERRIWRVYRNVTIIFAIVNGLCTSYAFLYLKYRLEAAGGVSGSILDNLLFIIIISMVFEFFAEPITGDWADAYGRRRVLVGAFGGLALAFLCYWSISAGAVAALEPTAEFRLVIGLALAAEFLFSVSAALFNGALDAWFVDELRLVGGPHAGALLPLFAVQRRWFGVFMVIGGAVSLWIGSSAVQTGDPAAPAAAGLTAPTALPWLAAAGVTAITALWVKVGMVERRVAVRGAEPTHRRIWLRVERAWRVRGLRNALVISSVLYSCWICFAYLLPVLLTERRITAEAGVFQDVVKDYYWYYLAMGTSRFLGPYLSERLWLGDDQIRRFRWWGVLNCGALAAGGIALLARSDGPTAGHPVLVPAALLVFWITKVAEEAFKPVRSTYLNHLVVDGGDRAFVLSMATPFGAVIILVGVGLLAAARHAVAALDETRFSVPLLFAILGGLGVLLTIKLSRSPTAG
jgi:MFS family permease